MKTITLTKGAECLVDDAIFPLVSQWKWHLGSDGYAARRTHAGKLVKLHNEIMKPPKGLYCDHINRNRLDNQMSNLRLCSFRQNLFNRTKQSGCSSQYRGVSYSKQANSWEAYCWIDGAKRNIGLFKDEVTAAIAADIWMIDIAGEFANPNFTPILYKSCPRVM